MALSTARVTDLTACPAHGAGTIAPPGKASVVIGNAPASRLAEQVVCIGPDAVQKGAATVLIGGLPATRLTDTTVHSAVVSAPCAPTVLIGGPAFEVPKVFTLTGSQDFLNKTIRDLYYLSTLSSGRELLDRLEAAGQPVEIREYSGDNGFCTPMDANAALAGIPTGSLVDYNPNLHFELYDEHGDPIPGPPQTILGHELVHALNNSEGTHHFGKDPSPPASQPDIEEEEAATIGTGSHSGASPTENSLRQDAGLPRRDNHYGSLPGPGTPGPHNLRPGTP